MTQSIIKVYVSNLGAYNNGNLTGKWTALPVEDINEIYKEDREQCGNLPGYGDEYFISDYEAPFKIDEYDNLNELNELAKSLQENYLTSLEDIYRYLDNLDDIFLPFLYAFNGDISEVSIDMDPQEAARATYFGNIKNWLDDYIYINEEGNFESMNQFEFEEMLKKNSEQIIEEYKAENL